MTARPEEEFAETVGRKAERRMRARRQGDRGVWFGLGLFGLVGWTIALPAVAGLALGVWMDGRWPGRISWTLTGLVTGMAVGCVAAWRWVNRESERE